MPMRKWTSDLSNLKPTEEACRLFFEGGQVLSQIEHNGIRIDMDYLNRTWKETGEQIEQYENELRSDELFEVWKDRYGEKSKLGSRDQLAYVLFQHLKNPVKERTDTGKPKMDAEALSHITHPFVEKYTKLENLKKDRNTFLKNIKIETVNGFLHPNYNLHLIISFRSSSDSPNFQNFPVRDPERAALIRRCFIAREGHQIVEVDFSGIEVRIAACYNHDQTLIDYILDDSTDMHADTAAELLLTTRNVIDKKHPARHMAKNMMVFPEFYGAYYVPCAMDMWAEMERRGMMIGEKTAREHLAVKGIKSLGRCDPGARPAAGTFERRVKEVEDSFWNVRFRKYSQWKRAWFRAYQEMGEFQTLTGFVCKGVFARNDVINYPIQGSAFHCLLWCLIRIQKELKRRKMRSKLLGQIHDSIVGDVHHRERDDYLQICKRIMTEELLKHWKWIIVPLAIEAEVAPLGASWHDKKKVELN